MNQVPALTRRRLKEDFECWGIFYCDVRVGRISEIHGTGGKMLWAWSCGFYPGCDRRTQMSAGNDDSFDGAKAAFQAAWSRLQPQITPAMIAEWREQQAFTAWKYAMWDAGCQMPTQSKVGRSKCYCGKEITVAGLASHVYGQHFQ